MTTKVKDSMMDSDAILSLTLAEAIGKTDSVEGMQVRIKERDNGLFEYKTGLTPNEWDVITANGSFQLELVINPLGFTSKMIGAAVDDSADDGAILNRGQLLSQSSKSPFILSEGTHRSSISTDILNRTIMKGAYLRENCIINYDIGINGLEFPVSPNSVSGVELYNFTVKSSNVYPDATNSTGINIDTTGAIRYLNMHDISIQGFKNSIAGDCPFFTCNLKNIQGLGIIVRDINDIPNYIEDDSIGISFGTPSRDATTVTCENVFMSGFGKAFYNKRCAALHFINCVAERSYYGVYGEKGLNGTMYQEWNKNSCRVVGSLSPSGIQITSINETSSWGPFTADTIDAARGSHLKSLIGGRSDKTYTDVVSLAASTATNYFQFQEENGSAISANSAPQNRIIGPYEVDVHIEDSNATPTLQGTYIFGIWVKEDGEATFRNVKRSFIQIVPSNDFLGSTTFNYKGVLRGNLSQTRVSIQRINGEAISFSGNDVTMTVRSILN